MPTVGDRVAQTAVALVLEPRLESVFHDDSYGYRRGKSAHDALAVTRTRCWERDWVLEKDSNRGGDHENVQFDFLGYTFRPRAAPSPLGGSFTAFLPAMSRAAAKAIRGQVHRWRPSLRSHASLEDMAEWFSPFIRGWINYYGRFYRNEFRQRIAVHLDRLLVRWAMTKFKRLRGRKRRAWAWLGALKRRQPTLFPHWSMA